MYEGDHCITVFTIIGLDGRISSNDESDQCMSCSVSLMFESHTRKETPSITESISYVCCFISFWHILLKQMFIALYNVTAAIYSSFSFSSH